MFLFNEISLPRVSMMLSLNQSTVSLDFVLFLVFHGHLKIKTGSQHMQVTIIFTNISNSS